MKDNKTMIIFVVWAIVLIAALVWVFARKPTQQPSQTLNTESSQSAVQSQVQSQTSNTNNSIPVAQNQTQSPTTTQNYAECVVNGQSISLKINDVAFWSKDKTTTLGMNPTGIKSDKSKPLIMIQFPGNTTGNFKQGKTVDPKNITAYIFYSSDGSNVQGYDDTYAGNASNDSNAQINITKYSGNIIVGTFSGNLIYSQQLFMKSDESRKVTVQCSFSSNIEIEKF